MTLDGQSNTGSVFDFGQVAQEYDRWYATAKGQAHDKVQKADVQHLLGFSPRKARLLDIGCGTAHWSRFFASLGYTVVGVDAAPEMIRVAQNRNSPGVTVHVAEASALPFPDASFDVAAAMAVLEFLSNPEAVLQEMVRCTKPQGRILIGSLNRLAPVNRQRLAERKEPYASGHLFSPDELAALLQPFGSVRMRASEIGNGNEENPLNAAGKERPPQEQLTGSLIIAEVRL